MKLKSFIVFQFVLVFVLTVFTGCFHKDDTIITDCRTGKVVVAFSSVKYAKEREMLLNADDNVEEKTVKLNSKPKYMVHFVDPKDSLHDVYFYVYIENNNVYVQYNMNKMQELENTFHVGLDDSVRKTNGITVKEFYSIINEFRK